MDLSNLELDDEVKKFLNEQKQFIIDGVSQEGGNCDIFFGHHEIFDRRIALKVYYGAGKNSSDEEPRILSKIDHPNILKVRYAERIGDSYSYFMTDEISGGDLEKCFNKGTLDLKTKLSIIHGILNGLTELHKEEISIVHRDIKPKNILIDDKTNVPLISDFGSVKQFDKAVGEVTGSKTTLVYRPKEVFESNIFTIQSDLYQTGVTMFQLLGGYFPDSCFDWLNEKEKKKWEVINGGYEQSIFEDAVISKLVKQNKLLKYDTLPRYINSNIVKIIKKATHPNLRLRYQNTAAFMNDLYKVQLRLTNWNVEGDILFAHKPKGNEFRIVPCKQGFKTEKKGKGDAWRRNGKESTDQISQILYVESL